MFQGVKWHDLLVPDTPLLEIFVRGTLVYLALFLLLRFVLKRQSSGLGVSDLLVLVLIADAAQNAMADDYKSVPDGVLLVAVIVGWAWMLDMLAFHVPRLERILRPEKLPIIRNGQRIRQHMAQEFVTDDELESQLRLQGIDDITKVKEANMEPDGRLSIVRTDGGEPNEPPETAAY